MNYTLPNGQNIEFPEGTRPDVIQAYVAKYHPPEPNIAGRIVGHLAKGAASVAEMGSNLSSYFHPSGETNIGPIQKYFEESAPAQMVTAHPETSTLGQLAGGLVEFLPQVPVYTVGGGAAIRGATAIPKIGKFAEALLTKSPSAMANYGKAIARGGIEGGVVGTAVGTPASSPIGEKLLEGGEEAIGFAGAIAVLHPVFAGLGIVGRGLFRKFRGDTAKVKTELEARAESDPAAAEDLATLNENLAKQTAEAEKPYVPTDVAAAEDVKVEPTKATQAELPLEPLPDETLGKFAELGYSEADLAGRTDKELIDILEKGTKNATTEGTQQTGGVAEHIGTEGLRPSAEAGSSDSTIESRLDQQPEGKAAEEAKPLTAKENRNKTRLEAMGYTPEEIDAMSPGEQIEALKAKPSVEKINKAPKLTADEVNELLRMGYQGFEIKKMGPEKARATIEAAKNHPPPTEEETAKAEAVAKQVFEAVQAKRATPETERVQLTEEQKAQVEADLEKELEGIENEPISKNAELVVGIATKMASYDPTLDTLLENMPKTKEEIILNWRNKIDDIVNERAGLADKAAKEEPLAKGKARRKREKIVDYAKEAEDWEAKLKEEGMPEELSFDGESTEGGGTLLDSLGGQQIYEWVYSKLKKAVDEKMGNRMPVEQMKKMLKGQGVSDAEIANVVGGMKGVVTKQDVLDEIKANTTKFEDVVLGEPRIIPYEKLDLRVKDWVNSLNARTISPEEFKFKVSGHGLDTIADSDGVHVVEKAASKFEFYQEPGSTPGSYREMFVTAPTTDFVKDSGFKGPEDVVKQYLDGMLTFEEATARGMSGKLNEIYGGWNDGHSAYYNIQNPIVRIRYNDRDVSGKKILFVEEMQGPSSTEQSKMPEWLQKRIYDIGTKRVLALAKEKGYDGVAWTTGEMQASRYDLSKHLDEVKIINTYDNKYGVIGKKEGKEFINTTVDTIQELEGTVGKELVSKFLDKENVGKEAVRFTGLDLKVGGEGLKRLYDQQIPSLMKKYGKGEVDKIDLGMNPDLRGLIGEDAVNALKYVREGKTLEVPYTPISQKTPSTFSLYSDPFGFQAAIDMTKKLLRERKTIASAPGNKIVAEINGKKLTIKDDADFVDGTMKQMASNIGNLARNKAMSPDFAFRDNKKVEPLIFNLHKKSFDGNFEASKHNEVIRSAESLIAELKDKEALKDFLEGKRDMSEATPAQREAARLIRGELDAVRDKYKGHLRGEFKKNLNEDEFAALSEIIAGRPIDEVIAKYRERVVPDKLGRRRTRKWLDEEVVRDIASEYSAIDKWGLDDYVTHYERGPL
ncbi:MAG: hypothetical protein WC208_15040, partial [Gallionella sp.]